MMTNMHTKMQKTLTEIDEILKEINEKGWQNEQFVLDFEDELNKRSIKY